jgi:hypothetical protein
MSLKNDVHLCVCIPQASHGWLAALLQHEFHIFTYFPGQPLNQGLPPNVEGGFLHLTTAPLYLVHTGGNHFMSLVSEMAYCMPVCRATHSDGDLEYYSFFTQIPFASQAEADAVIEELTPRPPEELAVEEEEGEKTPPPPPHDKGNKTLVKVGKANDKLVSLHWNTDSINSINCPIKST